MPTQLMLALQPFAIALAIGLFIGIERERSHPPGQQPLGSRTFVLLSLLGALAARLNDSVIGVAITLFVAIIITAGYWRSSRSTETINDIGFTTEVAAMLTYALGYLAHQEGFITILIGVVTLVVLMARTRLHLFSRKQLKPKELQASATLLVVGFIIIPFLPNESIDPWGFFNPQNFGILFFIILTLQFAAYLSIRLFGQSLGVILLGCLAGFVSSTSLTATIAQKNKQQEIDPLIGSCAIILACSAMFTEVLIIVYLISPTLAPFTLIPVFFTGGLMAIVALFISQFATQSHYIPATENPLVISSAVKLGLFLGSMLILVSLTQHYLGSEWISLITFFTGLFEIRGVTLALATLHQVGSLNSQQAIQQIIIALTASFISKYGLVWSMGTKRFAIISSALLTLMLVLLLSLWSISWLIK